MKKRILVIFGTRPEAIKMVPVIKALKENDNFITHVCVTAQHREMLDQVLELFSIVPDYDLNLMKTKQSLSNLTSSILMKLDKVINSFTPDLILVHGDTSTTFAASLSAYYNQIQIGHVEAGLRTGDLYSPWPEEANRKLTSVLTNYHFAPTKLSKQNLLDEGVDSKSIYITGNTVIDTLFITKKLIESNNSLSKSKNSSECSSRSSHTSIENSDSEYDEIIDDEDSEDTCSEVSSSIDSDIECCANIEDFPVQVICLEKMEAT